MIPNDIFDNPTIRWAFYLDTGTDLDQRGRPVLEGHILQPRLLHVAVWCPWCQTPHRHGAGGPGMVKAEGLRAADGHRVAHCTDPRSPFKRDGYVVQAVGYEDHATYQRRKTDCVVCGRGRRRGPDQPFHAGCEREYWRRFGSLLAADQER